MVVTIVIGGYSRSKAIGCFNGERVRRKKVNVPRYRDARNLRATVKPSSYCTGCIPYRCRRSLTARSSRKSHLSAVYIVQRDKFFLLLRERRGGRRIKLYAYLRGRAKAVGKFN